MILGGSPVGAASSKLTLGQLPTNALVKDPNTKYDNNPILFLVGHQATGRTKLITQNIITMKCFDAIEASNTDANRKLYGNNRYAYANLDSWLNSSAASWYTAKHTYDAPPSSANVWQSSGNPINPYDTEAGFLANFEADFRDAILDTTLTVALNTATDGGGSETLTRKVYLLSNTEVGLANENSIVEGTAWDLFSDNTSRLTYPTAEAVSKTNASGYTSTSLAANLPWWWWLRTPYASSSCRARYVHTSGSLSSTNAYSGYIGVRPALELDSSISVSNSPDTDGAYTLRF